MSSRAHPSSYWAVTLIRKSRHKMTHLLNAYAIFLEDFFMSRL